MFISSTFRDLRDERQAVLKAVLEMEHMPAGMELFAAGDDSAWQLIRDVIDDSDYYVLIIGGRYGSLDESGIGYTEKEYEYAIETKKPVIPLLHERPDNLPRDRTETNEASWGKLQKFRERVEKKHTCVYWMTVDELKARVVTSLLSTMRRHPAVGWIRADKVPSEDVLSELLMLRRKISELESEKSDGALLPPKGVDGLQQGDDVFVSEVEYVLYVSSNVYLGEGVEHGVETHLSWDQIFAAIAPGLIDDAPDAALRVLIRERFEAATKVLALKGKNKDKVFRKFKMPERDIDTCIVQLRALGLIRESERQRSVKDTKTYWRLTPHGDFRMTQLRALRRVEVIREEC
ncbi:hypothetical protein GCM10012319_52370 [Comamonas sp. KCTC 72670]|nr:DUF4062 domain-containing protein [Comamonas sp. JC664]GHG91490.1 hypothetical protein GCM10012319_52370 [Comamonas sp. KCTC 72670]